MSKVNTYTEIILRGANTSLTQARNATETILKRVNEQFIETLSSSWESYSNDTKNEISKSAAGNYHLNNFKVLMSGLVELRKAETEKYSKNKFVKKEESLKEGLQYLHKDEKVLNPNDTELFKSIKIPDELIEKSKELGIDKLIASTKKTVASVNTAKHKWVNGTQDEEEQFVNFLYNMNARIEELERKHDVKEITKDVAQELIKQIKIKSLR